MTERQRSYKHQPVESPEELNQEMKNTQQVEPLRRWAPAAAEHMVSHPGPNVDPPVAAEDGSTAAASLRIVADKLHPFMTVVDHLLRRPPAGCCTMTMSSARVTSSQSSGAALWCGGRDPPQMCSS